MNCVKWDPTGSLLASCSDDITAKVFIFSNFVIHLPLIFGLNFSFSFVLILE